MSEPDLDPPEQPHYPECQNSGHDWCVCKEVDRGYRTDFANERRKQAQESRVLDGRLHQ